MKVREIMTTDVECVVPDTGVRELANKMKTLDVGLFPRSRKGNPVRG